LGVFPGTDIWNELETGGFLRDGDHWETGIAVSEICPTAVPYKEIRQMVHEGFYRFVKRPSFISKQIARLIRSPYRVRTLINNLEHMGSIREGIRSVT
jgi:hypothetical protein